MSRPANLSMPRFEKRPDRASWSVASTCTAQYSAARNTSRLAEVLARLHSTSGGLSDTELKLLAVRPTGVPSTVRAVMMVTPVAKVPSALRNSVGSNAWAVIALPVRKRVEKKDRKSVVEGKSVEVSVEIGGARRMKKK